MEFLFSNYPPVKTGSRTFADVFYGLIPHASKLDIAVGYVSSDSLIELQKIIEFNSNIAELDIDTFNNENALLDGHEFVEKVSASGLAAAMNARTDIAFEIPIKPYEVSPHSNLNVFFGKGRESLNGLVKPRHWYEVELIVPKSVTSQAGYPQSRSSNAVFTVITDDGWSFKCKVSGDYSKNFRSEGDLKILGKWLKGRLENAGVLTVGSPVTADTLKRYGRDSFTLTQTTLPDVWFLNFEVEK